MPRSKKQEWDLADQIEDGDIFLGEVCYGPTRQYCNTGRYEVLRQEGTYTPEIIVKGIDRHNDHVLESLFGIDNLEMIVEGKKTTRRRR